MNGNRRQSLALVALVFLLGSLVSECGAQVEDFVDAKPSIKSMDPVNPGELLVEWAWSVKETPKDDWIVFLHLRKSGVEGAEGIPVGDYTPNLPTSKWPRGKTVKEFAPARYPAELSGNSTSWWASTDEMAQVARLWIVPWIRINAFLPASWKSGKAASSSPHPNSQLSLPDPVDLQRGRAWMARDHTGEPGNIWETP